MLFPPYLLKGVYQPRSFQRTKELPKSPLISFPHKKPICSSSNLEEQTVYVKQLLARYEKVPKVTCTGYRHKDNVSACRTKRFAAV